MSSAVEVIQTQTSVTFYSWIENKGCSQMVQIHGGERAMDGKGQVYRVPLKTVQFNRGILHTDDPEAIRELRKLAKSGGITEDREEYLRHVLPPEQQAARLREAAEQLTRDKEDLVLENSKLRQQLEALGQSQSAEREEPAPTTRRRRPPAVQPPSD